MQSVSQPAAAGWNKEVDKSRLVIKTGSTHDEDMRSLHTGYTCSHHHHCHPLCTGIHKHLPPLLIIQSQHPHSHMLPFQSLPFKSLYRRWQCSHLPRAFAHNATRPLCNRWSQHSRLCNSAFVTLTLFVTGVHKALTPSMHTCSHHPHPQNTIANGNVLVWTPRTLGGRGDSWGSQYF